MGTRKSFANARILHVGLVFALAGSTMGIHEAANASQPSSNVLEQHWDLLAETATVPATASAKDLPIRRGSLPGGTSKFDPAPTATFEVVGKHVGGGTNTKWTVALVTTGPSPSDILATVEFSSISSSSAPQLKTATITWPSIDRPLRIVRLTKHNALPNLAGSFEIKKAYIKINQQGVIKQTVSRMPVATKQIGITSVNWQNLTDIVYYEHRAGDFGPAPTAVSANHRHRGDLEPTASEPARPARQFLGRDR